MGHFGSKNHALDTNVDGQVENSEISETTEITEKAVKQGNYKFRQ